MRCRRFAICDLAKFFDPAHVLGRDEAVPKPDPDGIRKLLAAWGAAPATAVMVGDFRYDLEAGRRAEVTTIYYDAAESGSLDGLKPTSASKATPNCLPCCVGHTTETIPVSPTRHQQRRLTMFATGSKTQLGWLRRLALCAFLLSLVAGPSHRPNCIHQRNPLRQHRQGHRRSHRGRRASRNRSECRTGLRHGRLSPATQDLRNPRSWPHLAAQGRAGLGAGHCNGGRAQWLLFPRPNRRRR